MASYKITLNGKSHTLSTGNDAQTAAVSAARAIKNEALPGTKDGEVIPVEQRDGYLATDESYLEFVFGGWAKANPDFEAVDLQLAAARAFSSYAKEMPPDVVVEVPELSPEGKLAALKAYAASKRYDIETGGLVVSGTPVLTDRDTQAKLMGAYLLGQVNPAITFQWKTPAGFVKLNATQVTNLAVAVGMFVQSAYVAEQVVSAAIDAGTITNPAGIEKAEWPSNE